MVCGCKFVVHLDFKVHTGVIVAMVHVPMQSVSRKHKLNTRISTESELFAIDYASVYILCTVLFIKLQGYNIDKNILYQYSKSSILLDFDGKRSSGKRSLSLNIRYF